MSGLRRLSRSSLSRAFVCAAAALVASAGSSARAQEPAQGGRDTLTDDEPLLVLRRGLGDNELSLAVRGALQVRGTLPFDSAENPRARALGDLTEGAAFELRRVRLGLDATILPTVTAHVSSDLVDALTPARAKTPLFLAYGNVDARVIQLRAGLLRIPFTRHGLVDETRQLFLEPAAAWRADRVGFGRGPVPSVLPDRRIGAELHEEIDGYAFSFGVFSGGGAGATESATSAVIAGRLELALWGAVPLEGAYFRADPAYATPRITCAVGGLGRSGPDGSSRAISAAVAASFRGFYSSVEGVLGSAGLPSLASDVRQRALVVDVAYRFAFLAATSPSTAFELGVRGDVAQVDPSFDLAGELRALAGVANLYFWRHRVKASTLVRVVRARDASAGARDRHEGILELSVGF